MIAARARIGIKNSILEYSGKITLVCFGPDIKVLGTLTDISLDIDLQVDKNLVVNVHKFGISSDGNLNLEFRDLGAFDYLSEKVIILFLASIYSLLSLLSLCSDLGHTPRANCYSHSNHLFFTFRYQTT